MYEDVKRGSDLTAFAIDVAQMDYSGQNVIGIQVSTP